MLRGTRSILSSLDLMLPGKHGMAIGRCWLTPVAGALT